MVIRTKDRNLALIVAACFFMENLDATIVTTAAPRLARALHVTSGSIGLLVSAYLVTFAMGIPVGGWLVTRFGERRIFVMAIIVFSGASLLCAMSQSFGELIVARTLQGVGAALMVPVGRLIVLAHANKSDFLRLISFIVWPGLLAPVVAPFLGGVIVTYASWPWLFLVNVPIGVVALAYALAFIPESALSDAERVPLDVWGMLFVCVGLGGLVYVAFVASQTNSSWTHVVGVLGASSVTLAFAVTHLRRIRYPFIDLGALEIRSLRDSLRGISLFILAVGTIPMLLPLLFQNRFGWSPIKSGLLVLFVFAGNIGAKPPSTYLIRRFGHRYVLILATSGLVVTMILYSRVNATTSVYVIALLAFISGVFRSFGFTAFISLGFADVGPERMSAANVLSATAQQVFFGFAIALSVVALRVGYAFHHTSTHVFENSFSFTFAFFLVAAVAVSSLVQALIMPANSGNSLR